MLDNKILSLFQLPPDEYSVCAYGSGHINETYLVQGKLNRFILQRINDFIFKDVDGLMRNVSSVCEFRYDRVKAEGGDLNRCLRLIPTVSGDSYAVFEGKFYRVYNFIENTVAINIPESAEHFGKGGKCFAEFMKTLLDFDAASLVDVIPYFHDTARRVKKLKEVIEKDEFGRKAEVIDLIGFALERESAAGKIVSAIESGEIPLRVTHNDTKFNNLLFDEKTHDPVAVIDLDTIMKGSILYDFGDAVRTGCCTADEDEHDLTKVNFEYNYYKAFEKGYADVLSDLLVQSELDNFAFSSMLMTYECGVRFLTDYLEGDVYFKTHYDKQNVFRTRTQFKLVSEMEKKFGKMTD